ncbi:MAG: Ig-like domain-containing protein [Leifsonia sp.]
MSWLRTRRGVASVVALAVLAGVPLTFAVLHPGYPVSDVDLQAREVWVTNGKSLLAGRLNRQIEELDAAVPTASGDFDVMQSGDDVFVVDRSIGGVDRVDPSFVTLGQHVDIPVGSEIAYGGDSLAVMQPGTGKVWVIDAAGELVFDAKAKPVAKLGRNGHIAVSTTGTVFATDPDKGILYSVDGPGGAVSTHDLDISGDYQLSAVGERAIVLDERADALVVDGRSTELPGTGVRLQQAGADNSFAIVATDAALLEVPLDGGDVVTVDARIDGGTQDGIAAPVWLDGCAHGAWSAGRRYVAACTDEKTVRAEIPGVLPSTPVEFRVNRDVIALNDLATGDVWMVDSDMRLVENWDEVTPPEEEDAEEGDEKASKQSFEDTLAERTETNRPPIARDDTFGVRPGKTTVLPILDNDTDPDGDVLTVSRVGEVSEVQGRLDVIDGGRALQYTPAETAQGTVSFRYAVSDGRPGGVAEAQVSVAVKPLEVNEPPVAHREGAVSVEQGQLVGYNVLADWMDPDGDDLYLVSASSTTGDGVRFGPDGYVTFEHKSAELGLKEIPFVVSDGTATATGVLTVDVKATGTLNPVGTPDFAETFVNETVSVAPLDNDVTPSGAPLALLGITDVPAELSAVPNLERGTVAFSSAQPGSYIVMYSLGAGAASSIGLMRIDVKETPKDELPPIAVKDTAFLRAAEPVSVDVLTNDVSPSGRVLAVQSVDSSAAGDLVSVELLTNAVVRITASAALTQQVQLTYTVSDGVSTSTAGITVVPVPPLIKHQPPVAVDDAVNVRAGDIVTVPVLDNDYHPDSATMSVAPDLVDTSAAGGLVFVSGDTVRYQAPEAAGTYAASYQVADAFGESAVATVRFTVVARDGADNQAPTPLPLTMRTFAESTVKIDVPLDGIDPDGDSVYLRGVTTVPSFGRVVETKSDSIVYEAYPGAAGTDTFTYEVEDSLGKTAKGTIRIGVIPRPAVNQPPNAVDDTIEVKPGRTASVPVWRNDSDPNGYALVVSKKLLDVDKGITAKVAENRVVVDAPENEGTYSIRYQISNGHGGTDTAFLNVIVTEAAAPLYPTSIDQVIDQKEVADKKRLDVDVLAGAENPGGLIDDLVVTLEGENAGKGEILTGGRVRVEPGEKRQTIAYRLTNPDEKLSTTSFIVVPARPDAEDKDKADKETDFPPPFLKPMPDQTVKMNGTISWTVADIVEVPSGRPALVLTASATNGDGSAVNPNPATLTFTPAKDFRGPASVSFLVTDGATADDPKGKSALLTIPITVGDPNFEDAPPSFTPPAVKVAPGEDPVTIDLQDSTSHPNPALIPQVSYSGLSGTTADVQASLDGSKLTITSPLGVQPGTRATLTFQLKFKEFTVPGSVDVTIVSSPRPPPRAIDDNGDGNGIETRPSTTVQVKVLDNDFNPFAAQGQPLRVVGAELEQDVKGGAASVSFTATGVTIRTGPAATGTLTAVYRIQDATKDPARETQGRITLVIRDAPDQPKAPSASEGDQSATVAFSAPASNNSPITGYTISWSGGTKQVASAGSYTIGGLSNGTSYTFQVTATNAIGTSAASPASNAVRPFGKPGAPSSAKLTATSNGSGDMTMSWGAPADDGGRAISSYNLRFVAGSSWTGSDTGRSRPASGNPGTTYQYEVQACNTGGQCGGWERSNSATPTSPPPPAAAAYICKGGPSGGGNAVVMRYENFKGGSYRLVTALNGDSSAFSYSGPYDLGTNGKATLLNWLGVRHDASITVEISGGPTGLPRTNAITGDKWNSLSQGECTG